MLENNNNDNDPYGKEIPQQPVQDPKAQDLWDQKGDDQISDAP